MYWYVVHVRTNYTNQVIEFFNRFDDISAFVPKMERWYNIKGKKDYLIKDLYPDYVFIKTSLNLDEFKKQFHHFFNSVDNLASLLEHDDIYALDDQEVVLLEKMLNNEKIVRHSVGNIVNSVLIVDQGPLIGLEDKVIKIDRHKRLATLELSLSNKQMKVPLEVVSKS